MSLLVNSGYYRFNKVGLPQAQKCTYAVFICTEVSLVTGSLFTVLVAHIREF